MTHSFKLLNNAHIRRFRVSIGTSLIVSLVCLSGCFSSVSWTSSHAERAEAFSRQGEYDRAIEEYRLHIAERLALANRPEWENPYFYLVLIGDIRLGTGKPEEALEEFQRAEAQKVDPYLVADRYRSVAAWYESQHELAKSLAVLQKYRDRDPLLFDAMLDRVGKALTKEEDERLERSAVTIPHPPSAQTDMPQ